jgi:hypothetical protein
VLIRIEKGTATVSSYNLCRRQIVLLITIFSS